jgi:hypothetical protein
VHIENFVKILTRKNLPNFTKTNITFKYVWLSFISASKIKQNNSCVPPESYIMKNKTPPPHSLSLFTMNGPLKPCPLEYVTFGYVVSYKGVSKIAFKHSLIIHSLLANHVNHNMSRDHEEALYLIKLIFISILYIKAHPN